MRRILLAVSAALLIVALPAAVPSGGGAHAQSLADFERIDADKDGFVSLAEFEAARQRDFDLLDADKDGFLSHQEFVNQRGGDPKLRQMRERRFREIDSDGDRRIGRAEYLTYGRSLFTLLDRDRDGRIARAEFERALSVAAPPPPADRPARGPAVQPPPEEARQRAAFARIDRDGNGFISRAELDDARLEAFRRMDTDGSGRLTRAEIVAARGESAVARFAEMDDDKDGTVSQYEFLEAGRDEFRNADTDGDGRLTFEEFSRSPAR